MFASRTNACMFAQKSMGCRRSVWDFVTQRLEWLDGQIGWAVKANRRAKQSCPDSHGFVLADEDDKNSWFCRPAQWHIPPAERRKECDGPENGNFPSTGFVGLRKVASVPHLCPLPTWGMTYFAIFFIPKTNHNKFKGYCCRRFGRGKLADTANNNRLQQVLLF